MNNKNCMTEQDLTLLYYNELPTDGEQAQHLASCLFCKDRLSALCSTLGKLPKLALKVDQAAGPRMAARVSEQLNNRRKMWRPAVGASLVAALALVLTFSIWPPQTELKQTAQFTATQLLAENLDEEMPDIDFIEDFELLQELELLAHLEGV